MICVTGDQNLLFYALDENITRYKQIAGYNEEILDLEFVGDDNHVAVVSNTEQLRIYNLETLDCEILHGHYEIVLCVCSSNDRTMMITGSKDNSAIVWKIGNFPERSNITFESMAVLSGHTGPVSAVSMPKTSNSFVFTASHDRTVKFWNLTEKIPTAKYTFVAHEKDVTSIFITTDPIY